MPQTLKSVCPDADVILSPGAINREPQLAVQIAEAINLWSHTEAALGGILAMMLGADARPAMAMFSAIVSSQAQMAALHAAAKATAKPDHYQVFEAVLTVVRRAGKKRNRLAHWVWGASPDLPGVLLLLDPRSQWDWHTDIAEKTLTWVDRIDDLKPSPELDKSRILVFRHRDLTEIAKQISRARLLLTYLSVVISSNAAKAETVCAQLCSEPEIRSILDKVQKARPGKPEAPKR